MAEERLQKILSRAGVSSRRAAEDLILAGRVEINGKTVTELGTRADGRRDVIRVDNRLIAEAEDLVYYVLYKPERVVTTLSDPEGRQAVGDLLRGLKERIYPVGRLDYDAEGVLLLTNDGELAHKLTHPRWGVHRTYLAKVKGEPSDAVLERMREGVRLDDGMARALEATWEKRTPKNTWIRLVVAEGRHHLVKRLCEAVNHPVVRLYRNEYAGITAAGLRPGELRQLSAREVQALQKTVEKEAPPPPGGIRRKHNRAGAGAVRNPILGTTMRREGGGFGQGRRPFQDAPGGRGGPDRPSFGRPAFGRDDAPAGRTGRPAFGKPSFGRDAPAGRGGPDRPAFGKPSFGRDAPAGRGGPDRPSFGKPSFGRDAPAGRGGPDRPAFGKPSFGRDAPAGRPGTGRPPFGKPSFGRDDASAGRPETGRPSFGRDAPADRGGADRPSFGKPSFDRDAAPAGRPGTGRPSFGKPSFGGGGAPADRGDAAPGPSRLGFSRWAAEEGFDEERGQREPRAPEVRTQGSARAPFRSAGGARPGGPPRGARPSGGAPQGPRPSRPGGTKRPGGDKPRGPGRGSAGPRGGAGRGGPQRRGR